MAKPRLAQQYALFTLDDASDEEVLDRARSILERRMRSAGIELSSPSSVRTHLQCAMGTLDYEVFGVLFLDAQNRLIAYEEMFRGILTQTSVYPREVVKEALALNAAGLIFAHNHPSGVAEPSRADELLTQSLKNALAIVDVKVLDHFIVTAGAVMSFAERGLL